MKKWFYELSSSSYGTDQNRTKSVRYEKYLKDKEDRCYLGWSNWRSKSALKVSCFKIVNPLCKHGHTDSGKELCLELLPRQSNTKESKKQVVPVFSTLCTIRCTPLSNKCSKTNIHVFQLQCTITESRGCDILLPTYAMIRYRKLFFSKVEIHATLVHRLT